MRPRRAIFVSTSLALLAHAPAAFAQADEAQRADKSAPYDGEIIVTARKRAESIMRVPVVENVITAETIARFAINDIQDITTKIPGLMTGSTSVAIGEQMSLRGVGSNSLDQGVDQSVSLVIDGLQITHGLAFRAASFDLQQVEVFKGPQALYYGKNSTAGVIAFRSADPGDTLEIKGRIGYEFEAREQRAELVFSTPVTDNLGIRLAGLYSDSDGFFHNRAVGLPESGSRTPKHGRLGGSKSHLLRATVLWKPADNFTARLKANFTKDKSNFGSSTQLSSCPDGVNAPVVRPGFPNGIPFSPPAENCRYDRTLYLVDMDPAAHPGVRNNGTPFLDLRQTFGSLSLDYDFSREISLNSTTGYYHSKADTLINGTATGYAASSISADNVFSRRDFTQEFRLASDFQDSPVNFTVGAFYQDATVANKVTIGGNTVFFPPAAFPYAPGILAQGKSTIDIESFSAFGQLRWQVVEKLELAGGVRWTHEKRGLSVINTLTNAPVALAPGTDRISSKNWSPEVSATYLVNDDFTLFAAVKQAYKSGSFIIVTPPNPGDDKSFGDEKAQGGEVGIKSRWLDRSLSFDIAGYYYRYNGLQTGVNEPVLGTGLPILRTINAGKAQIHGVDMELNYRSTSIEGLNLNLAANWNKTKFLELNNVPCWGGQLISQGCNQVLNPNTGRYTSQNLKGTGFVRAPEWQVNFGFDYEMPVGNDLTLGFGVANQFVSRYQTILGKRADFFQASYIKSDLNVTLYGPDDKWDIGFVVNNIQNTIRPGYCSAYDAMASGLGPSQSGGTTRNASGVAEVGCASAPGRAIWLRAGFRL